MHPWTQIRKANNLTQISVAEKLGVTRFMVGKLEQSQFDHPPKELLSGLAQIYNTTEQSLLESWGVYVRETRDSFALRHHSFSEVFNNGYSGINHPLVHYREVESLSRYALCRGLCLHYDPISDYEQNRQRTTPEGLVKACEYLKWDINPLEEQVYEWKRSGRADEAKRERKAIA